MSEDFSQNPTMQYKLCIEEISQTVSSNQKRPLFSPFIFPPIMWWQYSWANWYTHLHQ